MEEIPELLYWRYLSVKKKLGPILIEYSFAAALCVTWTGDVHYSPRRKNPHRDVTVSFCHICVTFLYT